jgi:asparagine synthase (glutamine-hydrolysing)
MLFLNWGHYRMCGICGQVNFSGAPVRETTLKAMIASIRHRGPDSQKVTLRGSVGLGHVRLSIIDLSEAGNQPMISADRRKWIVYNGEIYNFAELRREMQADGENFYSSSDTEVLLRLYERQGAGCLQQLHGMFAFAIWDDAEQTLFLARDRIGIKPLYYYHDNGLFVFGSEIKALLQSPEVPKNINPEALITYFTFGHSCAPHTMFKGIQKLLPGHFLVCTAAGIRTVKYWDLDQVVPQRQVNYRDAAAQVCNLLTRAVTSHMVADVPVGAFLSGGIDSSAIVAFMSQVSSQPVKTFSVGFDIGGHYNELNDARIIARRFGTEHYETVVADLDVESLINRLVYHYDEPFADAANLPTFIISEFARQHVKVVLCGEGGDEIFGGYRRYLAELAAPSFLRIPAIIRNSIILRLARRIPKVRGNGAFEFSRRLSKALYTMSISEPDLRYGHWLAFLTKDLRAELLDCALQSTLASFDGFDIYRECYKRYPEWERLNRVLYMDLKTWLPDTYLEKIDKATMAVSLESRVPFLDHRLVEYVFSLPARLKVHGRTTKYILKKALRGVLPECTLYKPKHGFSVPLNEWFRGRLSQFARAVLLDSDTRSSGYLNPKNIEALLQQHTQGKDNFGDLLWALLNFELWHRSFISSSV